LNWRYPPVSGSPYLKKDIFLGGELAATLVVCVARQFGLKCLFIMEWFWLPEARQEALMLMREAMALGRSEGAHAAMTLAVPGSLQRRLLIRLGFLALPGFALPGTVVMVVRPETAYAKIGAWSAASNWYLTFGDGEIV
jgi:hypothetical protein